jgi:hypothetical protein
LTWWHWALLGCAALCAYYLEKIRDLIWTIAQILAHDRPDNAAAEAFLEDHAEKIREQFAHPFTWRLIRWWRN